MKAENIMHIVLNVRQDILEGVRISKGMYLTAWVDLQDMNIYHSINGELMALVFPTLDAFAKHIEQISEPKNDEQDGN